MLVRFFFPKRAFVRPGVSVKALEMTVLRGVSSSEDDPELSFFQGGSGYGRSRPRGVKRDPFNVEDAEVPWVDDWYRTRQGFARIQLLSKKTSLSVDQVQSRISQLLSVAPGLRQFMPLLHPVLFSSILKNLSRSFEIMSLLKTELPAVDLGTVIAGFPRFLTWERKLLYDCMCFLVVQFKGRQGAAEALNASPMRLKFARQLVEVIFTEQVAEPKKPSILRRLYQFKRSRDKAEPLRQTLFYFEKGPRLRE